MLLRSFSIHDLQSMLCDFVLEVLLGLIFAKFDKSIEIMNEDDNFECRKNIGLCIKIFFSVPRCVGT